MQKRANANGDGGGGEKGGGGGKGRGGVATIAGRGPWCRGDPRCANRDTCVPPRGGRARGLEAARCRAASGVSPQPVRAAGAARRAGGDAVLRSR